MTNGLDIWVIQNNPHAIFDALEGFENDNSTILYGNCASRFYIGKHKVEELGFNACLYSPKSDRLILITEQSEITLEQIEALLKQKNIVFNQVTLRNNKKNKAITKCKEMWIARDEKVLKEAAEDSAKNSDFRPSFYPTLSSIIMLGYYNEDRKFINMLCLRTQGIIEFDDKFICLTHDGAKNNMTLTSAIETLRDSGVIPNIYPKGYPSIVKMPKRRVRELTKSR